MVLGEMQFYLFIGKEIVTVEPLVGSTQDIQLLSSC